MIRLSVFEQTKKSEKQGSRPKKGPTAENQNSKKRFAYRTFLIQGRTLSNVGNQPTEVEEEEKTKEEEEQEEEEEEEKEEVTSPDQHLKPVLIEHRPFTVDKLSSYASGKKYITRKKVFNASNMNISKNKFQVSSFT